MKKSLIVTLIAAVALCCSLSVLAKDKKNSKSCTGVCPTEQVMPSNRVVYVEQGVALNKKTNASIKVHFYSDCTTMNGKKAQAVKCAELQRKGFKAQTCNTCEKRFDKITKDRMKEGNCTKTKTRSTTQNSCAKKQTGSCGGCSNH